MVPPGPAVVFTEMDFPTVCASRLSGRGSLHTVSPESRNLKVRAVSPLRTVCKRLHFHMCAKFHHMQVGSVELQTGLDWGRCVSSC